MWEHLDNAIHALSNMVDLPEETNDLTEKLSIDVQDIDLLKQYIEISLERKG